MKATDGFFSFGETIARLTRAFQIERGLMRSLGGWMAGVPYWDAKFALGDHLAEHAHYAGRLLKRLHELKEANAERRETGAMETFHRVLGAAPNGDDFLGGVYTAALPSLAKVFRAWSERVDPVMDPLARQLLAELAASLREQAQWFYGYDPRYSPGAVTIEAAWTARVEEALDALDLETGGWRAVPVADENGPHFEGFATPRRDACFRTAYFNEVARRSGDAFAERRRAIFYNHTQEMQFAESLGAILQDTRSVNELIQHCREILDDALQDERRAV